MTLKNIQDQIQTAIISPSKQAALDDLVVGDEKASVQERLNIYRRSYAGSLHQCMAAQFPVLCKTLGEDIFHQFSTEYLALYPSHSYSLNQLGANFTDYLTQSRPDQDEDQAEDESWIDFMIELADFEWQINQLFDQEYIPSKPLLDATDTSIQNPKMIRNMRVFHHRFSTYQYYYQILTLHKEADLPPQQSNFFVISRHDHTGDYRLQYHPLTHDEYDCLIYLTNNIPLSNSQHKAVMEKYPSWNQWSKRFKENA